MKFSLDNVGGHVKIGNAIIAQFRVSESFLKSIFKQPL